MSQLNFQTKVLDENGLFTAPWQQALGELAAIASQEFSSYNAGIVSTGGMVISGVVPYNFQYWRLGSICIVDIKVGFATSGGAKAVLMQLPFLYGGINDSTVHMVGYNTDGQTRNKNLVARLSVGAPGVLQVFAGGDDATNYVAGGCELTSTFAYRCRD